MGPQPSRELWASGPAEALRVPGPTVATPRDILARHHAHRPQIAYRGSRGSSGGRISLVMRGVFGGGPPSLFCILFILK